MARSALVVRLEAKDKKAGIVAEFLNNGPDLARPELGAATRFALRLGPSSFALFYTFANETGRQAYLNGKFIARLRAMAGTHFSQPPVIENAEILERGAVEKGEHRPIVLLRLRPGSRTRDLKASWLRLYL